MVFTRFLIHRFSKISIIRDLKVMLHGGSKWSFVDVGVFLIPSSFLFDNESWLMLGADWLGSGWPCAVGAGRTGFLTLGSCCFGGCPS